jgi:5-methylcytosine-specific restriction endonuclease McrA
MNTERKLIFDKFGGKCAYCGCELIKGWHIDHIEPIGRNYKIIPAGYIHYGTPSQKWEKEKKVPIPPQRPHLDTIENKNPACASCNINKHEMSIEEFRKFIKGFMKHLNELNTQFKIAKRYGLVTENDIEIKFYFETLNPNN